MNLSFFGLIFEKIKIKLIGQQISKPLLLQVKNIIYVSISLLMINSYIIGRYLNINIIRIIFQNRQMVTFLVAF